MRLHARRPRRASRPSPASTRERPPTPTRCPGRCARSDGERFSRAFRPTHWGVRREAFSRHQLAQRVDVHQRHGAVAAVASSAAAAVPPPDQGDRGTQQTLSVGTPCGQRVSHTRYEALDVEILGGDQPRHRCRAGSPQRPPGAPPPSCATAAPDPRATARATRWSENSACPAARSRDRTRLTVPSGSLGPQCRGTARSIIASAVEASSPMRITTVFRCARHRQHRRTRWDAPRTRTPPRPAEPSTAHRPAVVIHRSTGALRRNDDCCQPTSPATMSASTSRSAATAVDRPAASARSTSPALADCSAAIVAESPAAPQRPRRTRRSARRRCRAAARMPLAAPTALPAAARGCRNVQQLAAVGQRDSRSPAANAARSSPTVTSHSPTTTCWPATSRSKR